MTYPLTVEDRALQAKARQFADELIPYEVEAELHDGELPDEVVVPTAGAWRSWASTPSTCRRSSAATGTPPSSRR